MAEKHHVHLIMTHETQQDTVARSTETQGEDAGGSGWDPYILSIFSRKKKSFQEERRRKPRTREANRRRALLLAKARRSK